MSRSTEGTETVNLEDNSEDEIVDEPAESSKQESQRSLVYKHYKYDYVQKKFKCNYCGVNLKKDASGSTGNLGKHMKRIHKGILLKELGESGQKNILDFFHPIQEFVPEEFENRLLDFFIPTNQPLALCDDESFHSFSSYGRDQASIPSSSTLKRKVFRCYDAEKAELINKLKCAPGKISLVVDCWTSKNFISFHGVIASWISKDWTYEEVLLDMDILENGHSGKELAMSLIKVVEDFGISNKILAVTSDNASNCDKMFEEFEKELRKKGILFSAKDTRVRCLAHIVNLACQDALKALKGISAVNIQPCGNQTIPQDETAENESHGQEEEEEESAEENDVLLDSEGESGNDEVQQPRMSIYSRVRICIQKIRGSTRLRKNFLQACKLSNLKAKMLVRDNQVRWNTTLNMFRRVVELRKPFEAILRSEANLSVFSLTDVEWRFVEEMIKFLQPFEEVTLQMSKGMKPTMALTAAVYIVLFNHLESYSPRQHCEGVVTAAKAACDKLNKYYPQSDALVYVLGLVLDPRCKLEWYKTAGIPESVIKANKKAAIQYWKRINQSCPPAPRPAVTRGLDLVASQMLNANVEKPDDFRTYLSLPIADSEIITDILAWWRDNERGFPALAGLARDFLPANGTGVPIERAFAFGTDLLKPKMLALAGETIRRRFCLKAWRKYRLKNFHEAKMKAIAKVMVGGH